MLCCCIFPTPVSDKSSYCSTAPGSDRESFSKKRKKVRVTQKIFRSADISGPWGILPVKGLSHTYGTGGERLTEEQFTAAAEAYGDTLYRIKEAWDSDE